MQIQSMYIRTQAQQCSEFSLVHYMRTVLEIVVSIQTLSNHFGILFDPKKFGSDIWLSTTSCSFHTHSDDTKSFVLIENVYLCFHYFLMHIYCGTCVLLQKYVRASLKLSDPKNDARIFARPTLAPYF